MKREALDELKHLLRHYQQNRSAFWRIINELIQSDETLSSIDQQRKDLISQMKPLQEQLFKETAAFTDPTMRTAVNAYFRGVQVKSIAEPLEYSECHVSSMIKQAERILTKDDTGTSC